MIPQVSQQVYQRREDTMTPKAVRKLDPSLPKVRPTSHKRHWLELAEYASLGASALGSLAVALSGQAFYGVAPLTLALSLSVANRYRFEQQKVVSQDPEIAEVRRSLEKMERTTVAIVVKLRQQLSADIESLRQQIVAIPRSENFDSIDFEQQILSLGQSVSSLQEIVASALIEVRQQVSAEVQARSIPEAADIEPIREAIAQLQSMTKHLTENALTQEDWRVLNARFLLIQEAIATLQNDVQTISPQTGEDLSLIAAKINRLEQEQQEVLKPHLKRLIYVVKQLQQTE
ncbi:hypothetical protein PN499_11025 [Kamptonema animale CS-326]|jgi:hypothetical protein|uniref:hypothetical protein n=1 Tax=Kamptonema animale TaxID=92934 RepID=UPI00232E45C4|nr:hypothetical protein [Kamptonema animale]MDB9511717.1 hypothetical protein [Kamptonema animale CS-326]